MIKEYEVGRWLTNKQNISTVRGDLVDALILNSFFRLNADTPLGDIEEQQLKNKIEEVRLKLQNDNESEIDEVVGRVIYG